MPTSNSNVAKTTQQGSTTSPEVDDEFSDAFTEMVRNGRFVDWDYWVERETFGPKEAAMLANSIDPSRVGSNGQPGPTQGDWNEELRVSIQKKADSFAEKSSSWNLESLAKELGVNGTPRGMKNAIAKKNQVAKQGSSQTTVQATQTSASPSAPRSKQRHNILDSVIDQAVAVAGSKIPSNVYQKLKEMALNSVAPFNGVVDSDRLVYTNDKNELDCLSKDMLRKRLKRRT